MRPGSRGAQVRWWPAQVGSVPGDDYAGELPDDLQGNVSGDEWMPIELQGDVSGDEWMPIELQGDVSGDGWMPIELQGIVSDGG